MKDFKNIKIYLTDGDIEGLLNFRRDLETDNWHYYEKLDGKLVHIKKDKMIAVDEI